MPNFTKNAIKTSFLKLLDEYPLSKISVRTIVEDCGINRNTFYYHYQDIPTLLMEIVKDDINTLISKYPTVGSLDECVNLVFKFSLENKKAVLHIYNSVNRDIYEKYVMNICEYLVKTYFDTVFPKDAVSEFERDVAVRFFKCELFGLTFDWISNGMRDDLIEEIYRITNICRSFYAEILHKNGNKTDVNANDVS